RFSRDWSSDVCSSDLARSQIRRATSRPSMSSVLRSTRTPIVVRYSPLKRRCVKRAARLVLPTAFDPSRQIFLRIIGTGVSGGIHLHAERGAPLPGFLPGPPLLAQR